MSEYVFIMFFICFSIWVGKFLGSRLILEDYLSGFIRWKFENEKPEKADEKFESVGYYGENSAKLSKFTP